MKNESKWKFEIPLKQFKGEQIKGELTQMAKKDEKTEEVKPNYTRFLLGTYTDPKTQELMLGYAPFDPVTKMIGEFQSERAAGNQEVMLERYMVKQASLGILEQGNFTEERKTEIY